MTDRIEHVTVSVTIDTGDDDVTSDPYESVARILLGAAFGIRDHHASGVLLDQNGNRAGDWEMTLTRVQDEDEDEDEPEPWTHDPSHDGAGCSWCGDFAQVNDEYLCRTCYADGTEQ